MKPHALTAAYLASAIERPGMFYMDYDLTMLEQQLHGFDAALAASNLLGEYPSFNREFANFVFQETGLSGSNGWARALLKEHGQSAIAEQEFQRLVAAFLARQ